MTSDKGGEGGRVNGGNSQRGSQATWRKSWQTLNRTAARQAFALMDRATSCNSNESIPGSVRLQTARVLFDQLREEHTENRPCFVQATYSVHCWVGSGKCMYELA